MRTANNFTEMTYVNLTSINFSFFLVSKIKSSDVVPVGVDQCCWLVASGYTKLFAGEFVTIST